MMWRRFLRPPEEVTNRKELREAGKEANPRKKRASPAPPARTARRGRGLNLTRKRRSICQSMRRRTKNRSIGQM